jgi:hypothetical protein
MTRRTGVAEVSRYVRRVRRSREIRRVTGVAIRVFQRCIVAVLMAVLARNRCMRTDKRERCCRVIERRRLPNGGRVTGCTGMAEVAGHVVRIGRTGEICCVTRVAIGVLQRRVVAVRVARLARRRDMRPGQRERRC